MKKALICMVLIISLMAAALPVAAAPATAKDYLNIGNGFFNNEKYNDAIKNYDLGLKLEPKNTTILLKKADALYELLKFNDMAAVCDSVISINAAAQAYYKKGLALIGSGKWEEAVKMFDTVISKDPKYPDVYKKKAIALIRNSKFQDGISTLEKAFQQNPNDAELYSLKGDCLFGLQQYPDAIAALLKYLELVPAGDYSSFYKLSASYYKQNDQQNCFLYLRKAVASVLGIDMSLDKDPVLGELKTNTEFMEIIKDQKAMLKLVYAKVKVFDDPIFDTVSFLNPSNATDTDKASINAFKDTYNNNLFSGNIYNAATATQYNLSPDAAQRAVEIDYGRFARKMVLIGLKVMQITDSYEILYVGKSNGVLKAAVISIKGHTQVDGVDNTPYEDIYLYLNNNGIWQNYGLLN